MCTRVHQLVDHAGTRVQQMLAVVEDQQQVPVPKGGYQRCSNCLVGTLADTYSARHQVWHQAGIGGLWRAASTPARTRGARGAAPADVHSCSRSSTDNSRAATSRRAVSLYG